MICRNRYLRAFVQKCSSQKIPFLELFPAFAGLPYSPFCMKMGYFYCTPGGASFIHVGKEVRRGEGEKTNLITSDIVKE